MLLIFILSRTFPGCQFSFSIKDPVHLQVLLDDLQLDGWEDALASSSQHSLLGLDGCFLLQCLQTGAFLYIFCRSFRVFFSSLFAFAGLFIAVFIRIIISFIASVVDLMRISICFAWAYVRFAISSLVASACSLIKFALNCFAVSLFC